LTMAAVMVVGIITTLSVREPQVNRVYKHYKTTDYYRLVFVFFIAVATFVCCYIYSDDVVQYLQTQWKINDSILKFLMETVRFLGSGAGAIFVASLLIKFGVVNKQMAHETWVAPILDFFKRYGMKLALVLLLLIGFFRISDIIAGVISNVFYQDLNFSKEQIAEAVKIYGVIFSLVGGFLGGLLAQRMNIMKLMFVGAVLASSTNLIFIGLVKSGKPLDQVEVQVGDQHYQVQTDEVGYWKLQVPNEVLAKTNTVQVSTQYQKQADSKTQFEVPYLVNTQHAQIQLLPMSGDDQLTPKELKQSLVIKGQLAGVKAEQLNTERPVVLTLDGQEFVAKVDQNGLFTGVIDGKILQASPTKTITALANLNNNTSNELLATRQYHVDTASHAETDLNVDIQPIAVVDPAQSGMVELSGKVIKNYSSLWLYFAIIVDNLASGLAGAAFIAFLSSLTSVSFTAVQYAIFSSLMTLTPKLLGGYSGTIVSNIGYPNFFLMTTLIGIPILVLVVWVAKLLRDHEKQTTQQTGE
ncbi:MAG: MFS transporter, partial [Acinetobacter sp.]|nr:MFS transporter [Acinetobacter sp.]